MPARRMVSCAEVSEAIRSDVAKEAMRLKAEGVQPKLSLIRVGEDPASEVYVNNKIKACEKAGISSKVIHFKEPPSQQALIRRIKALNSDHRIHGILVQLPLPKDAKYDQDAILDSIDPKKDVDGLHPENLGLLAKKRPRFIPATVRGVLELLKANKLEMDGKNVAIVGRSEIVGLPAALSLLHGNATVTITHSRTRDLPAHTRNADIIVAAVGSPRFLRKENVKKGAFVVDVGINRLDEPEGDKHLVGDVHEEVAEKASHVTPVPGGVGLLTVASLLQNTIDAAKIQGRKTTLQKIGSRLKTNYWHQLAKRAGA